MFLRSLVNLQHLVVISLTNVLIQIFRRLDVDVGSRQECVNAHRYDEATFNLSLNPPLNN